MADTEQRTNQRMPNRSASVVGPELGNGPAPATPKAAADKIVVSVAPPAKDNPKPDQHK